jgi:mannose-1-phosphate guanylyltransferase
MNPWTVVLAAGAGRRLAEVTGGVPKQFWRAAGGRSLLRQTLDRFEPIAPRSRTVVVVDATHQPHLAGGDTADWAPDVEVQPVDRGTAAGVLLALLPVLSQAPDAVVVITPSDHGVRDEERFRQSVRRAIQEVRTTNTMVLFGVEPTEPQTDYGWMSLGPARPASPLRPVTAFVEKPERAIAARLFAGGAVWNTMVIVATVRTLWDLYVAKLPEVAEVFSGALRRPRELRRQFLADAYTTLAPRDFSRDLIGAASGLSACVWPAEIGWSDLGTPDRLRAWHHRQRPVGATCAA